jgi:hypothetical protein
MSTIQFHFFRVVSLTSMTLYSDKEPLVATISRFSFICPTINVLILKFTIYIFSHRFFCWGVKVVYSYTRWFKYDRDYLCVNKSQFVPVIFQPPCTYLILHFLREYNTAFLALGFLHGNKYLLPSWTTLKRDAASFSETSIIIIGN